MDAQTTTPTPTRRKSSNVRSTKARRDLQATIAQIDTLFPALADKPSKQADILCEKASAIKTLMSLEADERETEQDHRIKELEQQHEADSRHIAELKQQNASLRASSIPETVKVLDPEHAAVRRQNSELITLLKFVAGNISNEHQRAQMAIRIIQSCSPEAAKLAVPFLGFSYVDYAQMLLSYNTERALLEVISSAQREGPAVIFAKAALAVRDATVKTAAIDATETVQPEPPDNRSPGEKLAEEMIRQAKAVVRQSVPL